MNKMFSSMPTNLTFPPDRYFKFILSLVWNIKFHCLAWVWGRKSVKLICWFELRAGGCYFMFVPINSEKSALKVLAMAVKKFVLQQKSIKVEHSQPKCTCTWQQFRVRLSWLIFC